MRIAHMSDLHLEFEPPKTPGPAWAKLVAARKDQPGHPQIGPDLGGLQDLDLMILAGDVAQGIDGVAYADQVAAFLGCPVVYVPGNHEYYGQDFDALRPQIRQAAWETDGRVIFLDRDWTRLWLGDEQVVVLGCTLWSNYALTGNAANAMDYAAAHMNDHRRISRDHRWFMPQDALEEHQNSLTWLDAALSDLRKTAPSARLLVVTHHAPCRSGLGERHPDLKASYGSDLEPFILRHHPDWWLHGHTHHAHQTRIGRTLVSSAPRGYPKGNGDAERFRPALLPLELACTD